MTVASPMCTNRHDRGPFQPSEVNRPRVALSAIVKCSCRRYHDEELARPTRGSLTQDSNVSSSVSILPCGAGGANQYTTSRAGGLPSFAGTRQRLHCREPLQSPASKSEEFTSRQKSEHGITALFWLLIPQAMRGLRHRYPNLQLLRNQSLQFRTHELSSEMGISTVEQQRRYFEASDAFAVHWWVSIIGHRSTLQYRKTCELGHPVRAFFMYPRSSRCRCGTGRRGWHRPQTA